MSLKLTIQNKIADHSNEINATTKALTDLQKDFNDKVAKKALDTPVYAQKYMILKDKIMYHKACIAALKDILPEVTD